MKRLRLAMDTLDQIQDKLTEGEYLALCNGLQAKYEEPKSEIIIRVGTCDREHMYTDLTNLDENLARMDLNKYDSDPQVAMDSIIPQPFASGCIEQHVYEACCYLLKLYEVHPESIGPFRARILLIRQLLSVVNEPWVEEIRIRLGAMLNPCTREHVSNFDVDEALARLNLDTHVPDPFVQNPESFPDIILPCVSHHVFEWGIYILKLHETNNPAFDLYRDQIHGICEMLSSYPFPELCRRLHRLACSCKYLEYSNIEKDVSELDLSTYDPHPYKVWESLKARVSTECPQAVLYELCVYFIKLKREKPEMFNKLTLDPFYEQLRGCAVSWIDDILTILT